ncbi:MAG TPA: lytic transglycosylase domain-containing protein [Clostridia bacterium]|nr:lytic transglycosylase domain-containing protein [Clostridia bacterium]
MKKILYWVVLLFLIGIVFIYWFLKSPIMQKRIYPLKYEEEILEFSRQYDLDPHLVMGIIWVESKFVPEATSNKDAKGLMQIIPNTGKWIADQIGMDEYDEESLYDPETNIRFGCWYFAYLLGLFDGDVELALASYNGGMGNVKKWLKDDRYSDDGRHLKSIPFKETRDYLERVDDASKQYKKLYEI